MYALELLLRRGFRCPALYSGRRTQGKGASQIRTEVWERIEGNTLPAAVVDFNKIKDSQAKTGLGKSN